MFAMDDYYYYCCEDCAAANHLPNSHHCSSYAVAQQFFYFCFVFDNELAWPPTPEIDRPAITTWSQLQFQQRYTQSQTAEHPSPLVYRDIHTLPW